MGVDHDERRGGDVGPALAVAEDLDDSARRRGPEGSMLTTTFAGRGLCGVLLDDNQLGMGLK
jgi:hypothetical protein